MGSHRTARAVIAAAVVTAITAAVVLIMGFAWHGARGGRAQVSYNAVDMRAQMLDNGDLRITQTFDYRLESRGTPWRQMFQQYTLSSDRLTTISDISVTDLTTGRTYTQDTVHSPSGYGDAGWDSTCAGHWYIADITQSQSHPDPFDPELDALTATAVGEPAQTKDVEIGWNIPSTRSAKSMRFELAMTWHGVATAYDDVVALEWEPFSALNSTPAARVTGTFTFPKGISESNSWAWLHTGAASETTRLDDGSLQFTVTDLPGGEYINVVVMAERQPTSAVSREQAGRMKQRILEQERREARIASNARQREARERLVIWLIPAVLALLLVVGALVGAKRACAQGRRHTEALEYWREPPDMSPAAAAALITDVMPGIQGSRDDRQMTSTLLSLVTKGAVAIYPGSAAGYRGLDLSRADCVSIGQLIASDPRREADAAGMCTLVIMPRVYTDRAGLQLCRSESALLDVLLRASERIGLPVFDFGQMQAALKDWRQGYAWLRGFEDACNAEYQALHATVPVGVGARMLGGAAMIASWLTAFIYTAAVGQVALALVISLPLLFAATFAAAISPRQAFTAQGEAYADQVGGLMRYMEDFSAFGDRGVFDTVLWGRYMVYAAAFGISDKLMEQMERAYPQLADPEWANVHASNDGLVYWSARRRAMRARGGAFSMHGMHAGGSFSSMVSNSFSSVGSTIRDAMPQSSSSGSRSGSRSSGGGGSFRSGGFKGHSGGSGGGRGGAR